MALAQAATPPAESAATNDPQTLSLVQYIHPEKIYFWVPGFQNSAVRAGVYDLDVAAYETIRAQFDDAARGAATELLADGDFAGKVDRLPFAPGDLVAVLGESDTDSLQSWFEILRHVLDIRRPDDSIRFYNAGVSAMTTTQAFGPLMPILAQQPQWIFCALGANDAVRIGPEPTRTLVSLEETTRNFSELRRFAELATEARWFWLTRMPIDDARMEAYEPFRSGPLPSIWRNPDLQAINALLADQADPLIDIYAGFGTPPAPELQEADGLHPTLAGHQALARELVERLAA
jgi:lysophospholipase L1-like esterase